jgi:DNA polymerase-3 subunit delta'
LIEPADAMTHEAMNSLLKVLEEPGEDTLIMLVSSRPGFLPATVRSRCQRHDFAPPAREDALAWLQAQGIEQPLPLLAMANGSPLAALTMKDRDIPGFRIELMRDIENLFGGRDNPVALAEKWSSDDPALAIDWLSGCIMDLIRLKMGANPPGMTNPDMLNNLKTLAKQLDLNILYRHLEQAGKARNLLQGSVNDQVILEEVLIPWFQGARRRA